MTYGKFNQEIARHFARIVEDANGVISLGCGDLKIERTPHGVQLSEAAAKALADKLETIQRAAILKCENIIRAELGGGPRLQIILSEFAKLS